MLDKPEDVHLVHVEPSAVAGRVIGAEVYSREFLRVGLQILQVILRHAQILLPVVFRELECQRILTVGDRNTFGDPLVSMLDFGPGEIFIGSQRLCERIDVDILEDVRLTFVSHGDRVHGRLELEPLEDRILTEIH